MLKFFEFLKMAFVRWWNTESNASALHDALPPIGGNANPKTDASADMSMIAEVLATRKGEKQQRAAAAIVDAESETQSPSVGDYEIEYSTPESMPEYLDFESEVLSANKATVCMLIGLLMYIAVTERFDILYAVGLLARGPQKCTEELFERGLCVAAYLYGTKHYKTTYSGEAGLRLEACSDASHEEWGATSGNITMLAGAGISAVSKRQRCVTLSTCESETVAASVCAASWLRVACLCAGHYPDSEWQLKNGRTIELWANDSRRARAYSPLGEKGLWTPLRFLLGMSNRSTWDMVLASVGGHTCHHHQIIARILTDRFFNRRLDGMRRKFHKAWGYKLMNNEGRGEGPIHITVAVYCRSGKHRSVAAAIVLGHIFKAMGWSCEEEPTHLSRTQWGNKSCKWNCDECAQKPNQLSVLFNRALQLWQEFTSARSRVGQ